MSVVLEKNFNLGKIHFDLHRELNRAAGTIVKDIKNKVASGQSVSGGTLKPLKPATIKAKRKKGSPRPNVALYDTGRMAGSGSKKGVGGRGVFLSDPATKQNQTATISTAQDRQDIGTYHNEGAGNLPKREWFGISKKASKDAFRMIELRVEQMLRDA